MCTVKYDIQSRAQYLRPAKQESQWLSGESICQGTRRSWVRILIGAFPPLSFRHCLERSTAPHGLCLHTTWSIGMDCDVSSGLASFYLQGALIGVHLVVRPTDWVIAQRTVILGWTLTDGLTVCLGHTLRVELALHVGT